MKNAVVHLSARVRLLAPAVLAIIGLFSLSARAETRAPDSPDRELRALESQLAAALSSVDVDQISRLWAADFVSTMADGRVVSREKRLASLRAQKPLGGSEVKGTNEHVDVRVHGEWALVLVTSSWLSDGKRVGEPYQATHIWEKRDGRWRLVAAHISEVKP